ncbi:MAG: DUF805 domain-containing protein [Rhodobacterales bacterium]|nr:MAG: DUF805 domain-containing protein [Rhodobacterales bacterium]
MGSSESVRSVYSKYATFSGRASRSEYWWFVIFYSLAALSLSFLDSFLFGDVQKDAALYFAIIDRPIFSSIFAYATFLPALALTVRRLHDIDRTGWWALLGVFVLIGTIVLLVFMATKGTRGANRFGPDPNGGDATDFNEGTGTVYTSSRIPDVKRD